MDVDWAPKNADGISATGIIVCVFGNVIFWNIACMSLSSLCLQIDLSVGHCNEKMIKKVIKQV